MKKIKLTKKQIAQINIVLLNGYKEKVPGRYDTDWELYPELMQSYEAGDAYFGYKPMDFNINPIIGCRVTDVYARPSVYKQNTDAALQRDINYINHVDFNHWGEADFPYLHAGYIGIDSANTCKYTCIWYIQYDNDYYLIKETADNRYIKPSSEIEINRLITEGRI